MVEPGVKDMTCRHSVSTVTSAVHPVDRLAHVGGRMMRKES